LNYQSISLILIIEAFYWHLDFITSVYGAEAHAEVAVGDADIVAWEFVLALRLTNG
jgi:hypothetical protein